MHRGLIVVILVLAGCSSLWETESVDVSLQQPESRASESHSSISLELPTKVLRGEPVKGIICITIPPQWHTYGDPPGDSGMAPIFNFTLPQGWRSEVLTFPAAKEFVDAAGGTTFGYEGSVKIPFRLTAPTNSKPGESITVELSAQWLLCNDVCVPASGTVEKILTIIK